MVKHPKASSGWCIPQRDIRNLADWYGGKVIDIEISKRPHLSKRSHRWELVYRTESYGGCYLIPVPGPRYRLKRDALSALDMLPALPPA